MKYTEDEQRRIDLNKEQIRLAKERLTSIGIERTNRVRREVHEANAKRDRDSFKEDFDDRVRLFLSKMSRELKTLDLKAIESDHWPTGGQLGIADTKSRNSTIVKIIHGKGFEWN